MAKESRNTLWVQLDKKRHTACLLIDLKYYCRNTLWVQLDKKTNLSEENNQNRNYKSRNTLWVQLDKKKLVMIVGQKINL